MPEAEREPEDEAVRDLRAFSAGDHAAFNRLYLRALPSLEAWIRLRIGPGSQGLHGAEPGDLVQDIWLQVWASRAHYDESRGTFRSWMFAIADHVAVSALRKVYVRRALDTSRAEAKLAALPEEITTACARLARDEDNQRFYEVVSRLPPDDRKLFECRLAGMSFEETAALLQESSGALRMRWHRLKSTLKRNFRTLFCLPGDGGDDAAQP